MARNSGAAGFGFTDHFEAQIDPLFADTDFFSFEELNTDYVRNPMAPFAGHSSLPRS